MLLERERSGYVQSLTGLLGTGNIRVLSSWIQPVVVRLKVTVEVLRQEALEEAVSLIKAHN